MQTTERPKRFRPTAPRYDEVYYEGVAQLDRTATYACKRPLLPAKNMILAEIKSQLIVCETHLHALRKLLDEVVEND